MRVGFVVILLFMFAGAGAAFYLRANAPRRTDRGSETEHQFVALDSERAIDYYAGPNGPLAIDAVQLRGGRLASRWRWNSADNLSSYAWQWTRRGDYLAGELHTPTAAPVSSLVVVDWNNGVVARIDHLDSGAFAFADDHSVVAVANNEVRVIDAAQPSGGPEWHAPIPPAPAIARHVAGTAQHVIVWGNGDLRVYDRANPASQRTLGPLTDVIGVATGREEVLVLRDGHLSALSLADGSERVRVDLAETGQVTDGLDDPCLLGANAGNWLVVYATNLVAGVQVNGASWSVPASKVLASVDASSGRVLWRVPLGNWEVLCRDSVFQTELPRDRELFSPLVLRGEADVEGGRGRMSGLLESVDLATGAVQWRAEYPRSTGNNPFDAYRGRAFYTRADERNTLLRFEGGRLTGAFAMPVASAEYLSQSGVVEAAAWIGGPSWRVFVAPGLQMAAGAPGAATDRVAVAQQYQLPPAAR